MKKKHIHIIFLLFIIGCFAFVALIVRLSTPRFLSFSDFIHSVETADPNIFLVKKLVGGVKDKAAFEEMRDFILARYHGVVVIKTYTFEGSIIDCLDINYQSGVYKVPDAPPQLQPSSAEGNPEAGSREQMAKPVANTCDEGSIPMSRITLEWLTRMPTLEDALGPPP